MRTKSKIKIVVAMSGGVDSSVAAVLLKRAGFDVVGIFMKFWKDGKAEGPDGGRISDNRCCSTEAERLARAVAKKLAIPFYVVNVEKEFKKKVVDYFLKEYKKGNTPNPCVVCNKEIKFGFLIKKALSLGADFVATGHYVKTSLGGKLFSGIEAPLLPSASRPRPAKSLPPRSVTIKLLKGEDTRKDQSYFLWQLNQKQLKHVLFPVGSYTKPEVRKLARKFNLPTAETPESQEVCFIGDTVNNFLKKYLKAEPGKVILRNNSCELVKGEHKGLWFYTIGQRKGLEIPQGPWYVVGKDFEKNNLIVSKNQKDLEKKELIASGVNWILPQKLPLNADVKIRYKSDFTKAKIFDAGKGKVKIIFEKSPKGYPKAITPGQSAVFYKGEELLGGGVIE